MNSYPRMTLRQLCDVARENDIYIQSDEDVKGTYIFLSNVLRGCSGVMSMEIMKLSAFSDVEGELAFVAVLDIPAEWLKKEV